MVKQQSKGSHSPNIIGSYNAVGGSVNRDSSKRSLTFKIVAYGTGGFLLAILASVIANYIFTWLTTD